MGKIRDDTVKERRIRAEFFWPEIQDLFIMRALSAAGVVSGQKLFNSKVTMKQSTEGSPEYSIDKWTAIVEVTIKLD